MHCAQGAVYREGCLGQQRTHCLKHVAALDAAVQVGVDVPDEARLAAEVQQALQNPNESCVWDMLHVSTVCCLWVADKLHVLSHMSGSVLNLSSV